ncbi:16S rRNA (uracil(1498)-N(3))-methyltransferase [Leifsonia sp. 21MFCrub1.1]|uniref:16S rRNA (uracil(1498)-N(3))-methyltransferase n=1 Tax=Leifsonia sp. 21MFCrub1.1 TaxID=1798223 RepID=UPI000892901F|nr:16S rRNA (uracil(1498)-N(3))-methyltransferase [Leifsonia sp. 21MFCrub1.1]SEA83531.1 16S rRNA (uracil1498-N3)-methyltransferase [Leifsonia sp. 21MFCrub1.1]
MASLYLREDLDDVEVGARLSLSGAEAKHAATVNRTRPGESVLIGNGRGLVASGEVLVSTNTELTIDVDSVSRVERATPTITLVQALAKGDRDELAIQAATELGVDAVVPWAASRSVSRWEGAKVAKGRERWAAIVREASKQSIRAWTPEVRELATTKQVAALAADARVLVLEPDADAPLTGVEPDGRDLVLVVGPEGGIAPHELAAFRDAGAELVRLGSTVLRTSTAGPAALAVLNASLRRW